MSTIAFIDTEIDWKTKRVLDIGGIKGDGTWFHSPSIPDFIKFLNGSRFLCGHNILNHDIKYIGEALSDAGLNRLLLIDTLFLSPLLFPTNPYHALLKDDKLQTEESNNPLNDSIKAKDLFNDEVAAFRQADESLQRIFYFLLKDKREFKSFFEYLGYTTVSVDSGSLIRMRFADEICQNVALNDLIEEYPIELAYCLSLISTLIEHKEFHSITPRWVLKNYPEVERIMHRLRSSPCLAGCTYCNNRLDIHKGLRRFFGFDKFRTYGDVPLQEQAVASAVNNKSLLAVFPTGGGKSITFQVPALISGETLRGLTVVISPLQSLMKDQVDNLEKLGITQAVTINGLLDPIERAKSFERVEDGSAAILYISPESLRSPTIERLILGRKVVRFVVDEAHCFSSWGQDFRVDYLYIGDFIKLIQHKKNLQESIPVSCFTATAKQKVIEDIRDYFKDKLSLDLEIFSSKASRTNLQYKVFEKGNEEDKYQAVRDLIEEKDCPTIIYVSRTKKAYLLAERLSNDGFRAKPYHGKMDKQEKSENQDAFIRGETDIMVATSAFGMGVDKKDVGMVVHYEISDSLENYIQEAGRAGRDESITADCFVLYDEEDLSKHFILLNQTKLSIKEIQQIWKAIKDITRFRSKVSNSALEIARKAGWDDNVAEIGTRVSTAIAALEDAGYLKRGQNMPRVFANSILTKNVQEAIDKIHASDRFEEKQKEKGIRIIKKLFSSKSRKESNEELAESRIDYISDHLGIIKEEVINIVKLLREEKILADAKDLTAFIKRGENQSRSVNLVETFTKIENFLFSRLEEQEETYHVKELNQAAEEAGCADVSTRKIKTITNFWAIKNWIKFKTLDYSKNHIAMLSLHPRSELKEKLEKKHELGMFIIKFLVDKSLHLLSAADPAKEEVLVEFSVQELKAAYDSGLSLFKLNISIDDIEDALFYLSRIEALKIEGGFLVIYNSMTIERIEEDNKKRYTKDDYQKLNQFYENKVQQIHIVGEYAKRMISDYKDALQFVEDYFQLNYASFLRKYFPGSRSDELKLKMTPAKFKQLFGELSPPQLKIINDSESKNIAVLAGPGSGKTKVLVHKLASLLLMEDVKHEQLLMLTFSRAAAVEFKMRLQKLIGNAAHYINIKTFHSYCFDLLGKMGSLEKSELILQTAIEKIRNNDVEASLITTAVLVIDEAQDMSDNELKLITTLMEQNEEMRVIAVGDDDQNIYEFRGSSSRYLKEFIEGNQATKYELIVNYRSRSNLVEFTNKFVERIPGRLKVTPIIPIQTQKGRIKIVTYRSNNIVVPLVNLILKADLAGTTCVLTKTNEEALQVACLLLKNRVQSKLIQSNDGFYFYDLAEVRFFMNCLQMDDGVFVITDEIWKNAALELRNNFTTSTKLELVLNFIKDFEAANPIKKYKSDLETFVRESKLEDFFSQNGETIFVSTMHKAKGREFDNIFLLLDHLNTTSDESKRLLYVAMTRAKENLSIHLNSNFLDNIQVDNLERLEDIATYLPPDELVMHSTFKDVWLDYFITRQHLITDLRSGDNLRISSDSCTTERGQPVLKFSTAFLNTIESQRQRGYVLTKVKVNFIVYWQKEGSEEEIKIVLPELQFEKQVAI